MNAIFFIYIAILFFLLTPGILLTLPSKTSSKMTVAAVHAIAFAILVSLTCKYVWQLSTLRVVMQNLQ
jgi:hypothetical protein